jgi:hypothetical protein
MGRFGRGQMAREAGDHHLGCCGLRSSTSDGIERRAKDR